MKLASFVTCAAFIITSIGVLGQSYEIAGYVVDQDTEEPIPYASVGVTEQERGISTNLNGFFRLLLPEYNPDHLLKISSVGYQGKSIKLSEISLEQQQRFLLTPATRMLDEVVVVGKYQTLDDLVRETSKNRKVYLRSTPYLMNGFYNETVSVDNKYAGITEAQGIMYLNGYDPRYKNNSNHLTYDLIQWKNIRRSNYPAETQQYLEVAALLKAKDYYLHQGPLNKSNLNEFEYTVSDTTVYQDRMVLEILFEPRQPPADSFNYSGKMLVKEDDQALISLTINSTGPENFLKRNSKHSNIRSIFKLDFMLFENQYYLQSASLSRTYEMNDHRYSWTTELIGASFTNQQATYINYAQREVLYSEMLNPKVHYDPKFWADNNLSLNGWYDVVSEDIPDLEKQVEDNHDLRLVPLPEGFENYQQIANDRSALEFIMQR
ncbi:MAG: hypothetical protein DHS20C17_08760 [Cyclobacteriaceae bacterium]|nr:MAG: hypothetical protein DHS20C17_08760 [Cyclobacteriaceae bacterium]